mmetsp:Transcript_92736/g.267780  ORF Transcript_92736/g.267780 Transcript_92736/m.267780 type:complete len:405 (+) Transcript_92736:363-1577(+)
MNAQTKSSERQNLLLTCHRAAIGAAWLSLTHSTPSPASSAAKLRASTSLDRCCIPRLKNAVASATNDAPAMSACPTKRRRSPAATGEGIATTFISSLSTSGSKGGCASLAGLQKPTRSCSKSKTDTNCCKNTPPSTHNSSSGSGTVNGPKRPPGNGKSASPPCCKRRPVDAVVLPTTCRHVVTLLFNLPSSHVTLCSQSLPPSKVVESSTCSPVITAPSGTLAWSFGKGKGNRNGSSASKSACEPSPPKPGNCGSLPKPPRPSPFRSPVSAMPGMDGMGGIVGMGGMSSEFGGLIGICGIPGSVSMPGRGNVSSEPRDGMPRPEAFAPARWHVVLFFVTVPFSRTTSCMQVRPSGCRTIELVSSRSPSVGGNVMLNGNRPLPKPRIKSESIPKGLPIPNAADFC